MRISAVVCAYRLDRVSDIAEAVASLRRQTFAPQEVIVVADRVEGLRESLRRVLPGEVRLIENEWGQGLSQARNTGIRSANGTAIAFLDDDAVAAPTWLAHLMDAFSDHSVVAATGRALPVWRGSGQRPWWFPEELDWIVGCAYAGLGTERRFVRNVAGSNMCFRRNVLERVGGFDARVGGPVGGDDTEICLKILAADPLYRIAYEPRAIVYHKVAPSRQTFRYLLYFSSIHGAGKGIIRRIHPNHPQALSSEWAYLRHLAFSFFPGRIRALLAGHWQALGHISAVLLSICGTIYGYYSTRLADLLARLQGRPESIGYHVPKRG